MMIFLTDQFASLIKLLNNNNKKIYEKVSQVSFLESEKKTKPKPKSKTYKNQTLGYAFLKFIC